MKNDLYQKLVDLYAAGELTEELEETLQAEAVVDSSLAHAMQHMRAMNLRGQIPQPEFTEESYQRILMKLYFRGADIQPRSPEPAHLQYHLPIQT